MFIGIGIGITAMAVRGVVAAIRGFLLMETGDALLTEAGDKIQF